METEKCVEKRLVVSIKKLGGQAVKLNSVSMAGLPDRIILLPGGNIIFVELKSPKGKLSELQHRALAMLTGLGFDCRVLASKGEVDEFIESL